MITMNYLSMGVCTKMPTKTWVEEGNPASYNNTKYGEICVTRAYCRSGTSMVRRVKFQLGTYMY